jgi:dTDP-4-dehydrorhamnose reductase
VNPHAIIARVNFYGWSLDGQRSLAEFFYNNLSKGVRVPGFTDVYFCPLLVNDLAKILLDMLQAQLSGLYHVVSSQAISKYDFGRLLAEVFQMDPSLIAPTSVQQVGLKAPRSRILTLETAKISRALDQTMPDVSSGMQHFYQLFKTGFPARLQSMQIPTSQSPG